MANNFTLLFSEILNKVHKAKTKAQKVEILQRYDTQSLRILLKASFDPTKEWVIPTGEVPYTPNDAPEGTEHTVLAQEAKKLWHFIKGADNETKQSQKENMFIQICEGLHESEAKLLIVAKDKRLHLHCAGGYRSIIAASILKANGFNDLCDVVGGYNAISKTNI